MTTDDRWERLAAIELRYPKPRAGGVAVTVPQATADIWFLQDQLALCERTIARLASERDRERARGDAAMRTINETVACDPAKLADVFFNGRKA